MDAAIEIGLAVVATTLTICAVFIPVAFMGGIAGEFFRPFGFTVTVAVLFSLLVARTLTPMMAAFFLRPHEEVVKTPRIMTWYLGRVRWCLANRWKTLGVATVVIGGMLALFPLLPTGFSPAGDNGFTRLTIELAPGSSLEDTLAVAETVRKRLATLPDFNGCYTAIGTQGRSSGFGGGGSAGTVRRANLTITIENRPARAARSRPSSGVRPSSCATFRAPESNSTAATPIGWGSRSRATTRARSRAPRRTSSVRCASCRASARSRAAPRCSSPRS